MPKCSFNNKIECDFKYRDAEFARQTEEAQKTPKGCINRIYYSCTCMVDYRQCPRYMQNMQLQNTK